MKVSEVDFDDSEAAIKRVYLRMVARRYKPQLFIEAGTSEGHTTAARVLHALAVFAAAILFMEWYFDRRCR